MEKVIISGYAVCRVTPEGFIEDADFCRDFGEAYKSLMFYRSLGDNNKIWLEPRHMSFTKA